MKVLFIIPHLTWGGAEKQLALLARGLQARRCQVLVCALAGGRDATAGLDKAGVPVEILGTGGRLDPRPLARLWRRLRAFLPDVVHTWRPYGNLLGRLIAAGATAAPVVATAHLPRDVPHAWQAWSHRQLHRRTARWIASHAALADQWHALGVPRAQLAVIPPAAAPADPAPDDGPALRQALGLPAQAQLIVYLGRFLPHKGVKEAIWSLDILKYLHANLYLVLAGEGPQRYRLEQFAHDIRVKDQVRFLRPREDVTDLLRAADVVWIPSLADEVPDVALEAMAVGRPVVASRWPGIASVVVDGETGFLVPPGDKPALARQTRVLLEQPDLRRRMGEAGRQHLARHFTPEAMVERHLELYQQVIRVDLLQRGGMPP
jgi:glycosyltransferase involved in cell wall biosynthesis